MIRNYLRPSNFFNIFPKFEMASFFFSFFLFFFNIWLAEKEKQQQQQQTNECMKLWL